MNNTQDIAFNLPEESIFGFMTINGTKMLAIVIPPHPLNPVPHAFYYVELFAEADEGPRKRIAYWCDPSQPHLYVIYQPDLLAAKKLKLTATFYKPNEYPSYKEAIPT